MVGTPQPQPQPQPDTASVASLRSELASAFAARPRPADGDLVAGHSDEADEALDWLRGKTWRDVLDEGMGLAQRDLVHFLSLDGWLYFYPAFATFALEPGHPAEMDDTLTTRLGFQDAVALQQRMTSAERRAVVHWLEHQASVADERGDRHNLPRTALQAYWTTEESDDVLS